MLIFKEVIRCIAKNSMYFSNRAKTGKKYIEKIHQIATSTTGLIVATLVLVVALMVD